MKAKDLAEFLMTVLHYATTLGIEAAVQIMSNWIGAGEGVTAEDFGGCVKTTRLPRSS